MEMHVLNHIPILGELTSEELEVIRSFLHVNDFEDSTEIVRQNQATAHFHIILSGHVNVYVQQQTKVHVATLKVGEFFGEMSCLTGGVVSATVQAQGTVQTVSMQREGLLQLMDLSAKFRNHMIEAMAQRIMSSNDRVLEEHTKSVDILRQITKEQQSRYGDLVGESEFMRNLLSRITDLAQRDHRLCIVGEGGVGKTHVAWAIHAQSERKQYPVFILEGKDFRLEDWELKSHTATGGTMILRNADVLPNDLLHRLIQSLDDTRLIMTANQPLDLAEECIKIIPLRERMEDILALIHSFIVEAGFEKSHDLISQEALNLIMNFPFLGDNIRELKQVVHDALIRSDGKIVRISHLRFGSKRKPGTRPKIALALGSGAARGAAHVGVIKVLEEAGIPIDLIAGTSVGAFIGALYAGGQPTSAFERVLPTVRWRQLVRPTFTFDGLVDNHPMVRFVEKYIGAVDFKDLKIPFAAVASNAANGESYILNKGKVSHAICASTAIPGVIKPVKLGDHLLLDGAVAHPVPVALAKSMGADIIIAVDVSVPDAMKHVPTNFVSTILNTIDIMSKRMIKDELQMADFVLNPLFDTSAMSFKESAICIRAGEEVASKVIPAVKQKMLELGEREAMS